MKELLVWLQGHLNSLFAQSESVALLDMLVSFADHVMVSPLQYTRPECTDGGPLLINQGRHPVVADISSQQEFVANNTVIDEFRYGVCVRELAYASVVLFLPSIGECVHIVERHAQNS